MVTAATTHSVEDEEQAYRQCPASCDHGCKHHSPMYTCQKIIENINRNKTKTAILHCVPQLAAPCFILAFVQGAAK